MRRQAVIEPPRTLPELLTVAQVARYLHITTETVRDRIARGEIPTIKHGRRRYIVATELEKVVMGRDLS